jgi:PTS system nitrogen regulatory IIA component
LEGSVCFLKSREKFAAIHELLHTASVFRILEENDEFERGVISREKRQSTGFGCGVAVAHGQSPELNSVVLAMGISRTGIPYGSPDGKPVHLLFLIASSPQEQEEYLLALSVLVKLLRNVSFRKELMAVRSLPRAEELLHTNFCKQLEEEVSKRIREGS